MGCVGISSINLSGSCSGSLSNLEISLDGGTTYTTAGSGPWSFSSSLQPNGELKFRGTITKPGCDNQIISASYSPDPECFYGHFGMIYYAKDNSTQYAIPTGSGTFNYTVDWGDGTINAGQTSTTYHTYPNSGSYTVKISGSFPSISFLGASNDAREGLTKIYQWGTNLWESFEDAFYSCPNFTEVIAKDTPNLSNVTSLINMFYGSVLLNKINNVNSWDVSNVQYTSNMFRSTSFDGDIGNWDVGEVISIQNMFRENSNFNNGGNNSINNWNTSKVIDMGNVFRDSYAFNQTLSGWDTSKVITFEGMFRSASQFTKDDWDHWSLASVGTGSSASSRSNSMANMFDHSGMTSDAYDYALYYFLFKMGGTTLTRRPNINFGAAGIQYGPVGEDARNQLIASPISWSITDGGLI
jgi:surface protein